MPVLTSLMALARNSSLQMLVGFENARPLTDAVGMRMWTDELPVFSASSLPLANSFGLFDLLSSCLYLSEDINSTGSILVSEERPEAIVAVGNAFSGGRAGV
ncbi:hypothetical protein POTOM_019276 [Populus tomentosa]|uniref:Uncharacterized protein n=1 Tax=Populus tomentosa TaxID=118781 RepID=A0A8X7ZV67_POPTO|nr:hypothetical protein POTOM_019276 [Populus tomentosa]